MQNASDPDAILLFKPAEPSRNPHTDALAARTTPDQLAEYLNVQRAFLIARIRDAVSNEMGCGGYAPPGGLETSQAFSDLMDAVISRMFALACSETRLSPRLIENLPLSIVATGGYGRRELSPFSDIDLAFVPLRENDSTLDRVIRVMFRLVMEVCIGRCGLEVGYGYRLVEDGDHLDHQSQCGLLDARLIAGSSRVFIQFEDAFWNTFNAPEFIFTKLREREAMQAKWGASPRTVEPQLKEGAGGLRDLQSLVWLVQARNFLPAARVRGARVWDILRAKAGLTRRETERLAAAKELIFQSRNILHALGNAKRDTLVRTRQEEVAACLGYAPAATPPVEAYMADLYPRLALIRQTAEMVTRQIRNSRLMLGIGLDCENGAIVPANHALDMEEPIWMLWAFDLKQKYGLALDQQTEQIMTALVEVNPVLLAENSAAHVFTTLLARRERLYETLQAMSDTGVLGWMLPEFGALLDLIPYDPSHDYTVGQHSLLLVRNLEQLGEPCESEEGGEMQTVWRGLAHPEQLVLAALLHDSGKAFPGRPHAEVSEEIVTRVCARLGWTAEAAANVAFLCRWHLLMAETSRLHDLNLDETIAGFVSVVDDPERLNMLYLLTYADTRAVGQGVWTASKGKYLSDLWRRAHYRLTEQNPDETGEIQVSRARKRLLRDLSLANLPPNEVAEHIAAMPASYLLNAPQNEIALHIGYVNRVRTGQPVVEFRSLADELATEMTVCAYDDPQPGLLAKIGGVLYASDINVHSAQVFTRITATDRIALDILAADFKGRPLTSGKKREVAANLQAVLTGERTVEEIVARRRVSGLRAAKSASPSERRYVVRLIRNELSETFTIVDVEGPDTPGGFYIICDALSRLGWNISSARVSSWYGRGRAVFYVFGARGLDETEAQSQMEAMLDALTLPASK